MTPASAGQAISTTWKPARLTAIAAASRSRGTSPGMSACRAGSATALSPDPAATRPYSAHKDGRPVAVSASSAAGTAAWPTVTVMTSRRRSTRSASVPPGRVTSTSGMSAASPRPPTAAVDRVSSNTWSETAKPVIAEPVRDSMFPSHSRRKAALSRSGATSVSKRTATLYDPAVTL